MNNVPGSVKGLVYYVENVLTNPSNPNSITIQEFWKLVRETIVPPQSNSIENINKSLESLLKLVEELKVRIGGA